MKRDPAPTTSVSTQDAELVLVDQVWENLDGKAPVRIGRVWSSDYFCGGGTFVRAHPLKGGKVWVATDDDFQKHYRLRHSDGQADG